MITLRICWPTRMPMYLTHRDVEVKAIYNGGGTPSLLSGPAMQTLLDGVRAPESGSGC